MVTRRPRSIMASIADWLRLNNLSRLPPFEGWLAGVRNFANAPGASNSSGAASGGCITGLSFQSRPKNTSHRSHRHFPREFELLPNQNADFNTPPSSRTAAPLIPDTRGLHTKATTDAISSTVSNRFSNDVGRTRAKNPRSNSLKLLPPDSRSAKPSCPSDRVGPGSTELTVTPVPAVVSASPRAIATCALLVIP
jgi:hypothetical protein